MAKKKKEETLEAEEEADLEPEEEEEEEQPFSLQEFAKLLKKKIYSSKKKSLAEVSP